MASTRNGVGAVTLFLSAAAAVAVLPGCGAERRDPLPQAVVASSPHLATGERAFMQHCHQCHPGGAAGLGPALNDKPAPEGLIKLQVRQGLGTMPAFNADQIPDAQLDALAEYMLALREQPPLAGR